MSKMPFRGKKGKHKEALSLRKQQTNTYCVLLFVQLGVIMMNGAWQVDSQSGIVSAVGSKVMLLNTPEIFYYAALLLLLFARVVHCSCTRLFQNMKRRFPQRNYCLRFLWHVEQPN